MLLIEKSKRLLTVTETGESFPVALGLEPVGAKCREGDGRTPEGVYFVCMKKQGKYGPSLGVSYPNEADALRGHAPRELLECIRERAARCERPPWGSFLGGEIFIHGGGIQTDWTQGCIALRDEDAAKLYTIAEIGMKIEIRA